jgi:hypothetical protein
MQNVRKLLLSVGAAIAGTKIIRAVSDLEVDDLLAPMGLTRRRMHVGQDLALIAAGALVGGAVALIFAPASGRETRQRIARKYEELNEAATDKFREIRDEMRPRLGNASASEPT